MKGSNKGEREGSEVLGREREGRGGNRYKRIVKWEGRKVLRRESREKGGRAKGRDGVEDGEGK